MSKNSQQQEWEDFVGRVRTAVEKSGGPSLVANRSGLARRTINAYLVGETDPSRERILALAEATDVRPEWLLTGQGPMRLEGVAEQSIPYRADALDEVRMREVIELTEEYLAPLNPDERPAPAQIAGLIMKFYAIEVEMNLPPQGMRDRILPFLKSLRAG
jgi:transcriptional regulator with XRE-family HTH domain